jgi:hypothetical protein
MGTTQQAASISWQQLDGQIAKAILHAPKTGGDPNGGWLYVHEHIAGYLLRNVVGTPWGDHLSLIAAVLSARKQDVQTVRMTIMSLHARFSALFPALGLKTMDEWKNELHFPPYIHEQMIPEDSQYTRQQFLTRYASATRHLQNWLDALPDKDQQTYQPFILPVVSPFLYEQLNKMDQIVQQQQAHRKAETEAILPHFAALRAEAHYRYNRLMRLRQAYFQAVAQVPADHSNLPLEFSYEEGDPPLERLHFKVWDRRCLVLDPEHVTGYSPKTREKAARGWASFSGERNALFLEFVKVERLNGETPPEGFWFTDLLKLGLLGASARDGNEQEVAARQAWLRQWGYGEGNTEEERTAPFTTQVAGLLTWSSEQGNSGVSIGRFLSQARQRTGKVFVPVESLYAAATFGLLALDLLIHWHA